MFPSHSSVSSPWARQHLPVLTWFWDTKVSKNDSFLFAHLIHNLKYVLLQTYK